MEAWAYIPGVDVKYIVSDQGRVFSYHSNKFLKPGRMSSGHVSVALGRGNSRCVHELVLLAFKGPRPPGYEGRHLNGVPNDNRLTNLEWATKSRNSQDKKYHNGAKVYKLTPRDVKQIKYLLASKTFTGVQIAKLYGVSKSTIYAVKSGVFHKDVV